MSSQTAMSKLLRLATLCSLLSLGSAFTPSTKVELSTAVTAYLANPTIANLTYGNIRHWNVSKVTDMSAMFYDKLLYDADLSAWDVSKVTNMNSMFAEADGLDGRVLSKWDVSRVTDMGSMFAHCYGCSPDLSMWNVSSVTDMGMMFVHTAGSYNNLGKWDVSKVVDMYGMFNKAYGSFGDLAKWDVSNVKSFLDMFSQVGPKGDLSNWNVSVDAKVDGMFNSFPCQPIKQYLPWNVLVNGQVECACFGDHCQGHKVLQDSTGNSPRILV